MSRLFYHVMQDNAGNLLFDVSGTMRLAGTGTAATIYGDEALTVPIANPMTNHPSFGSFKCFLGVGDYDFYMAKSGYTFETLTGVQGSGTMADQNASAVSIGGGTLTGLTSVAIGTGGAYPLDVNGQSRLNAPVGLRVVPDPNIALKIHWLRSLGPCLRILHGDTDAGNTSALEFQNLAGSPVGSITTTSTATAFNTTSDARLKRAVTPLIGALDVIRALRPITGRWIADDSPLYGFLAHEVTEVVDGVITGLPNAVDEEGRIVPQMIDPSKLVVWLTAGLKDTLAVIDVLTARVATLEAALGI